MSYTYLKMPDLFGVEKVRKKKPQGYKRDAHGNRVPIYMEWGKPHMIDFLTRIAEEWTRDFYSHMDVHGNLAYIALGDISFEGGSPTRHKIRYVCGHSSHRCGVDVDLYFIAKDGIPREDIVYSESEASNFDLERTQMLGKSILTLGNQNIDKILVGGKKLIQFMKDEAGKLGMAGTILPDHSTMHENHFHIRLKTKDRQPC